MVTDLSSASGDAMAAEHEAASPRPCPLCGESLIPKMYSDGYFHEETDCLLADWNVNPDGGGVDDWNRRVDAFTSRHQPSPAPSTQRGGGGLRGWNKALDTFKEQTKLAEQVATLSAEVERLREVLTEKAVRDVIDAPSLEGGKVIGRWCELCDAQWGLAEPSRHGHDCPLHTRAALEAKFLIAGPRADVCDGCVALFGEIAAERNAATLPSEAPEQGTQRPDDSALRSRIKELEEGLRNVIDGISFVGSARLASHDFHARVEQALHVLHARRLVPGK